MKKSVITRCLLWLAIVSLAFSTIACPKANSAEKKLQGTWYYVNGNDQITKVYISLGKEGEMKIGIEDGNASITQEEWNELLSGIFGNFSDLIKSTGINLDISAVDLSETLSGILSMSYEVKDEEEIRFTLTALKLINISHTSQYNFKQNGDLVLNGMVFRKK